MFEEECSNDDLGLILIFIGYGESCLCAQINKCN